MALNFTWDSNKASANKKKHDVSFEDGCTVFGDVLSVTVSDPLHSVGENRFVTIGRGKNGKMLVVIHADIGDNIRIISVRPATRQETSNYEQG